MVLNLSREELETVAEKMRRAVEEMEISANGGPPLSVTISIGATLASAVDGLDKSAILKKADELLYSSKNQGRNRISVG